jgi:hypothetical protein
LRAGSISTPQPTPQNLPGAGPALPQHLAVHPYSQPNLPLGHFANMISYPFLPQSYTYMPSAFQQGFAGNSTYHQSLAAMLPQYKNSVSVSSLPQSAGVASGYAFGSSTSIPGGNFPLNQPAAPTGTTVGYDDVLSSQYKDSNHLISLQQQVFSLLGFGNIIKLKYLPSIIFINTLFLLSENGIFHNMIKTFQYKSTRKCLPLLYSSH